MEQARKYDIERFLWGKSESDLASISSSLFESARALASQISPFYVFEAIGSHNPDWTSVVLPGAMEQVYLGPFSRRELGGPVATIRNADIVILSGLKTDKLAAIAAIVDRGTAGLVICGGALAMAFVKSQGRPIGQADSPEFSGEKWFISRERAEQARRILARAKQQGTEVVLPIDFVLDDGTVSQVVTAGHTQRDVGPASRELFRRRITQFLDTQHSVTKVFYNGALGQFEESEFSTGTDDLVSFLCTIGKARTDVDVYVGGGDARLALTRFGDIGGTTHVFTCGGAVLKAIGSGVLHYPASLCTYSSRNT